MSFEQPQAGKPAENKQKDSGYERQREDFYIDPPFCTQVLLEHESIPGPVLDPSAGSGVIVNTLREYGVNAHGQDMMERDYPIPGGRDFLAPDCPLAVTPASIVCNPPYGIAGQFVERARTIAERKVALLVRQDFLSGQKRRHMLREADRVIVLSKRPSMPPPGVLRGGGQHDFCWVIWSDENRTRQVDFGFPGETE